MAIKSGQVGAVVGVLVLLFMVWFLFDDEGGSHNDADAADSQFAVVIDAGSSGSRVHVYEVRKEAGSFNVVDELFEQLKPGLSACVLVSGNHHFCALSNNPPVVVFDCHWRVRS